MSERPLNVQYHIAHGCLGGRDACIGCEIAALEEEVERLEAKCERLERALRRECRCRPVVTQTIGGHDVGRPKCRACLALEEGREP